MVNQVYRLMKSEVAKRVLFLVDRRALAAQAVRAFSSFEPEPGLKFDKIYEVYSQRFQREDFDEAARRALKLRPGSLSVLHRRCDGGPWVFPGKSKASHLAHLKPPIPPGKGGCFASPGGETVIDSPLGDGLAIPHSRMPNFGHFRAGPAPAISADSLLARQGAIIKPTLFRWSCSRKANCRREKLPAYWSGCRLETAAPSHNSYPPCMENCAELQPAI